MNTHDVLATAWGEFPAPAGLREAYEAAPKKKIVELDWDGHQYERTVVDGATPAGKAYLAWEREAITAIEIAQSEKEPTA